MGMIRKERPGVDGEGHGLCEGSQARDEVGAIHAITEDRGPLDPPHHHLVGVPVEDSGRRAEGIETRLTWHDTAKGTTRRRRMQGPVLLIPVFLRPDLSPDGLGQSVLLGLGKFGDLPKNFLKRLGHVCLFTEILCESYTGSL